MSTFAHLVRRRVNAAAQQGTLGRNTGKLLGGPVGRKYVEAGTQALDYLTRNNGPCSQDDRCQRVWQVLSVAHQSGTPGDVRTALTQLQSLLRSLTEEDSDVGADEHVQLFRRQLNRLLD